MYLGVVPGNNATTCPVSGTPDPYPGLYYKNTGGGQPGNISVIAYRDIWRKYPNVLVYYDNIRKASYAYDPVPRCGYRHCFRSRGHDME